MWLHAIIISFSSAMSYATVVEIRTIEGNIQVNLFDEATPQTVANFLDYVNSGAFANNVIHRSIPNFVVQMGGYQYNGSIPLDNVPTGPAVINEPELSNVRGTLAMAKQGGNPNSATSQFFINLQNNSAGNPRLDTTNGGFTVFGQVIGDGMDVVDRLAAITTFNFGGPFEDIPLRNYTATDASNNVTWTDNNLAIITDIVVIDSATVTNPNLNPVPNTLLNTTPSNPQTPDTGGSGGGGTLGIFWLCAIGLIGAIRVRAARM